MVGAAVEAEEAQLEPSLAGDVGVEETSEELETKEVDEEEDEDAG